MKSGLNEMFYDGRSDEAKVERPSENLFFVYFEHIYRIGVKNWR